MMSASNPQQILEKTEPLRGVKHVKPPIRPKPVLPPRPKEIPGSGTDNKSPLPSPTCCSPTLDLPSAVKISQLTGPQPYGTRRTSLKRWSSSVGEDANQENNASSPVENRSIDLPSKITAQPLSAPLRPLQTGPAWKGKSPFMLTTRGWGEQRLSLSRDHNESEVASQKPGPGSASKDTDAQKREKYATNVQSFSRMTPEEKPATHVQGSEASLGGVKMVSSGFGSSESKDLQSPPPPQSDLYFESTEWVSRENHKEDILVPSIGSKPSIPVRAPRSQAEGENLKNAIGYDDVGHTLLSDDIIRDKNHQPELHLDPLGDVIYTQPTDTTHQQQPKDTNVTSKPLPPKPKDRKKPSVQFTVPKADDPPEGPSSLDSALSEPEERETKEYREYMRRWHIKDGKEEESASRGHQETEEEERGTSPGTAEPLGYVRTQIANYTMTPQDGIRREDKTSKAPTGHTTSPRSDRQNVDVGGSSFRHKEVRFTDEEEDAPSISHPAKLYDNQDTKRPEDGDEDHGSFQKTEPGVKNVEYVPHFTPTPTDSSAAPRLERGQDIYHLKSTEDHSELHKHTDSKEPPESEDKPPPQEMYSPSKGGHPSRARPQDEPTPKSPKAKVGDFQDLESSIKDSACRVIQSSDRREHKDGIQYYNINSQSPRDGEQVKHGGDGSEEQHYSCSQLEEPLHERAQSEEPAPAHAPPEKPVHTEAPSKDIRHAYAPSEEPAPTHAPPERPIHTEAPSKEILHMYAPSEEPVPTHAPPERPVRTKAPSKDLVHTYAPSEDLVHAYTSPEEPVPTHAPPERPVRTEAPSKDILHAYAPSEELVHAYTSPEEPVPAHAPPERPVRTKAPSKDLVHTYTPSEDLLHTYSSPEEPVPSHSPSQRPVHTEAPFKDILHTEAPSEEPVPTHAPPERPVRTKAPSKDIVHTYSPSEDLVHAYTSPEEPVPAHAPPERPVRTKAPSKDIVHTYTPSEEPVHAYTSPEEPVPTHAQEQVQGHSQSEEDSHKYAVLKKAQYAYDKPEKLVYTYRHPEEPGHQSECHQPEKLDETPEQPEESDYHNIPSGEDSHGYVELKKAQYAYDKPEKLAYTYRHPEEPGHQSECHQPEKLDETPEQPDYHNIPSGEDSHGYVELKKARYGYDEPEKLAYTYRYAEEPGHPNIPSEEDSHRYAELKRARYGYDEPEKLVYTYGHSEESDHPNIQSQEDSHKYAVLKKARYGYDEPEKLAYTYRHPEEQGHQRESHQPEQLDKTYEQPEEPDPPNIPSVEDSQRYAELKKARYGYDEPEKLAYTYRHPEEQGHQSECHQPEKQDEIYEHPEEPGHPNIPSVEDSQRYAELKKARYGYDEPEKLAYTYRHPEEQGHRSEWNQPEKQDEIYEHPEEPGHPNIPSVEDSQRYAELKKARYGYDEPEKLAYTYRHPEEQGHRSEWNQPEKQDEIYEHPEEPVSLNVQSEELSHRHEPSKTPTLTYIQSEKPVSTYDQTEESYPQETQRPEEPEKVYEHQEKTKHAQPEDPPEKIMPQVKFDESHYQQVQLEEQDYQQEQSKEPSNQQGRSEESYYLGKHSKGQNDQQAQSEEPNSSYAQVENHRLSTEQEYIDVHAAGREGAHVTPPKSERTPPKYLERQHRNSSPEESPHQEDSTPERSHKEQDLRYAQQEEPKTFETHTVEREREDVPPEQRECTVRDGYPQPEESQDTRGDDGLAKRTYNEKGINGHSELEESECDEERTGGPKSSDETNEESPAETESDTEETPEENNFDFLEGTAVLDTSLMRGRASLGKKRYHRTPAGACASQDEDDPEYWMFRDSTDPKCSPAIDEEDEEKEEEPETPETPETSPSSVKSPTKKGGLFSGIKLKGRLKSRNKNSQDEGTKSDPKESQDPTSPGKDKTESSSHSLGWLQALKKKKKKKETK